MPGVGQRFDSGLGIRHLAPSAHFCIRLSASMAMNPNLRIPTKNNSWPDPGEPGQDAADFTSAETGALAHLYRGEVYRSTIWRTRLDTTANWSVILTGVSFSVAFATPEATTLPLILAGLLLSVFLMHEARRYRYFNVWRARARLMEMDFYAPILRGQGSRRDGRWNILLADDYDHPQFHISHARAIGRRLRKNYLWIFGIQALAYCGKLAIHPTPLERWAQVVPRAAVGPIPGEVVLGLGVLFYGFWIGFAVVTYLIDRAARRDRRPLIALA